MSPSSPALVVGRISIRDAEAWSAYRAQVPGSLEAFGGRILARAAEGILLGGSLAGTAAPHPDVVVLQFPDAVQAQAWFDSPRYQALVPLRERAADVVLTLYPG